jgi:hypothetical protein
MQFDMIIELVQEAISQAGPAKQGIKAKQFTAPNLWFQQLSGEWQSAHLQRLTQPDFWCPVFTAALTAKSTCAE